MLLFSHRRTKRRAVMVTLVAWVVALAHGADAMQGHQHQHGGMPKQ